MPHFLLYLVYELIRAHSCLIKEAQTPQKPSPTVRHMALAQEQTHTEAKAIRARTGVLHLHHRFT